MKEGECGAAEAFWPEDLGLVGLVSDPWKVVVGNECVF